jgi:predicted transcriptional regulator
MSTRTSMAFRKWRKRVNLSQIDAGKRLGISTCCVSLYDNGYRYSPPGPVHVPLHIRLACAAIEHGLLPIDNQRRD